MSHSSTWALAAMLLLSTCALKTSDAYVVNSGVLPRSMQRVTAARQGLALTMQKQDFTVTRRAMGTFVLATAAGGVLWPEASSADMLDIVTGSQKSNDFLARLKVGKAYLPTLKCSDKTQACWSRDDNLWYDFPGDDEMEGYTTTPSGLKIKDLPVKPDVEELVKTSPSPDVTEGTNTIEIFVAGYLLSPRYRTATDEAIAEFYDPNSKKSKYFDIRNRDPRMFQLGKITLSLGKSKLIAGFEEGVSTMRVGMRRSIIIPPQLAYGDKGQDTGTAFFKPIPPGGTLLYQIELQKIVRG